MDTRELDKGAKDAAAPHRLPSRRDWIKGFKIGLGTSVAFFIADVLGLVNVGSAGIVTLLTIVSTKRETVRLSCTRLLTFVIAVGMVIVLFQLPFNLWLMFFVYIGILVVLNEQMGWQSTLSVNAVIGTHFLVGQDFSPAFIGNELMLVVIGIVVALMVNLIQANPDYETALKRNMAETESKLVRIITEMAGYLKGEEEGLDAWTDLEKLESDIKDYLLKAYEYEGNTFRSHNGFYLSYFQMRQEQCMEFFSLHHEMKRLWALPEEAGILAGCMLYMKEFVTERNYPVNQRERLEALKRVMKARALPVTREEFENRAILYHIMSQMEAFLEHKENFINELDAKHRKLYLEGKV